MKEADLLLDPFLNALSEEQFVTEPTRTRSRGRLLLIPAGAFFCGLVATVAFSRLQSAPMRAVYRQEVVTVRASESGLLVEVKQPYGSSVRPGDALAAFEVSEIAEQLKALKDEEKRVQSQLEVAIAEATIQHTLKKTEIEKERLDLRLRCADLLRSRLEVQTRINAVKENDGSGKNIARNANTISLTSAETFGMNRRLELADLTNHEEVLDAQIALCDDRIAELEKLQESLAKQINHSCHVETLTDELNQLRLRRSELESSPKTLTANSPAHGRVGIYRKQLGDYVAAGETIVEVFDAERPYLLMTVPISSVREFPVQSRVRVEIEGIKTRKPLEGCVTDVILDSERDADSATSPGASLATIRVSPVGRLWPLASPGMAAIIRPIPD